jgi:Uma2 family endonuclease
MVYLSSPLELGLQVTDEQFLEVCQKHGDLQFEQNVNGGLIIMSPTGGLTGDPFGIWLSPARNADLTYQLKAWNRKYKLGKVFDSSTGFKLPNGASRSPDTSFITQEKWDNLTPQEKEKFLPLCPDFVVELRSNSDKLKKIQAKMQEYMKNGARLGWLIDPIREVVEIYRPNQETEILEYPETVSGEDVLPDFVLDLSEIFETE